MAKNSQHVVPDPNGGWSVKKEGASRASKRFDHMRDAIAHAKSIGKDQKAEVVIHRRDGTIASKDSYGNDLAPHQGRDTHK